MARHRPKSVYAVAMGHQPGLYRDWDSCKAQVHGFRDARFKGFGTLDDAKAFMREHGVENCVHFGDQTDKSAPVAATPPPPLPATRMIHAQISRIKAEEPSSTPPSSFRAHWDFIRASQNLEPGSQGWQEWSQQRTSAGGEKIQEICFDGRTELEGFQELCRLVGIARPAKTIPDCRASIKRKLVNIFQLIDAVDDGVQVPVWPSENWRAFQSYTLELDNRYDLEVAKKCKILSCFLQNFRSLRRQTRQNQLELAPDNVPIRSNSHDHSDSDNDSGSDDHSGPVNDSELESDSCSEDGVSADSLPDTPHIPENRSKRRFFPEADSPDQQPTTKRTRFRTSEKPTQYEAPFHAASLLRRKESTPLDNSTQVVLEVDDLSCCPSPPPSAQVPAEESSE